MWRSFCRSLLCQVMGALVGVIVSGLVVMVVLAIGGLEHGQITRGMWQLAGKLTAMAAVGTAFGLGTACEQKSLGAALTVATIVGGLCAHLMVVSFIGYRVAPHYPWAEDIGAPLQAEQENTR